MDPSFPIIRSEWEQGQSTLISQVAQLPIAETVTHGNRFFHLVALHDDALIPVGTARLPEVLGFGRMEHAVSASHLEAFDVHIATGTATLVNQHAIVLDEHILIRRALADDALHAVGLVQRQERQALAHLLLLGRVYLRTLVGIDGIVGAHQSAVGNNL